MVNALARFEGFMQELMDRRVVRLLGGSLQPVELAHAIARCLDASTSPSVAPNRFEVLLNPSDAADLRALDGSLERKLAKYAVELARERGLNFREAPTVLLTADAEVERGRVDVRAEVTGGPRPDPGRGRGPRPGFAESRAAGRPAAGESPWQRPARPGRARPHASPRPAADAPWRHGTDSEWLAAPTRPGEGSAAGELFGAASGPAPSVAGTRDSAATPEEPDGSWQAGMPAPVQLSGMPASRRRPFGLYLEVPQPGGRLARLSVDHLPFAIGRREGSDLVLADPRVSRQHAVIEEHDGRYHLRDLGSRNGSRINGQPLAEAELRDGDRVAIGGFEVVVRFGQA